MVLEILSALASLVTLGSFVINHVRLPNYQTKKSILVDKYLNPWLEKY